ncbi:MAG TPA: UPF0175 family protein [Candidatus Binatia bacterium]|jgi:hypothetical protein
MAKSFRLDVPKQVKGKKLEEDFLITAQTILKEQTVLRLYNENKVSTSAAAKMLSMPLHDFIQFASQHHISVFLTTQRRNWMPNFALADAWCRLPGRTRRISDDSGGRFRAADQSRVDNAP